MDKKLSGLIMGSGLKKKNAAASAPPPSIPATQQLIESPKMVNIHKFVSEQEDEEEETEREEDEPCQQIAWQILKGTFREVQYIEYANFLGAKENLKVLINFTTLLKPLPASLLLSLHSLVSKVYFIAEAQNIDRILEELSKQWVDCHPNTHWQSHYSLCHIVLFSLLILNSDLHNTENLGNQLKFSAEAFIENTLFALHKEARSCGYVLVDVEPLIQDELLSYYDSLKETSLPLLIRSKSRQASRKVSRQLLRQDSKAKSNQQLGKRSSRFSMRSTTLTSMDTTSSTGTSIDSNSSPSIVKESHLTSNWRFHHNKPLPKLYFMEYSDEELNNKNNTLWFMDGLIKISDTELNHTKNNANDNEISQDDDKHKRDPKHFFRWFTGSKSKSFFEDTKYSIAFLDGSTKWIKARVRISEGRIFIFRLKSMSISKADAEQNLDNLKRNSTQFFVYNLYEGIATLVQDNIVLGNRDNHHFLNKDNSIKGNFTLTIPSRLHGEKIILEFQTSNVNEAQMFVQCINFWAARLTSVPSAQFEIVTNEEYGWSDKLLSANYPIENLNQVNVKSWKPLLCIGSLYDELGNMTDQPDIATRLNELQAFAEQLQQKIDTHNHLKLVIIETWKESTQFEKAMDNWNKKYLYLNELNERNSTYLEVMRMARASLQ